MPDLRLIPKTSCDQFADGMKNFAKHFLSQTPGVQVVSAAMIRIDQKISRIQIMYAMVSEFKILARRADCPEHCVVRETAQRKQHALGFELFDLTRQERSTAIDFSSQRPIRRR